MKTVLFLMAISLAVLVSVATVGLGQTNPNNNFYSDTARCTQCFNDGSICQVNWSCPYLKFKVPYSQNYTLKAWVACNPTQPNCGGCYACAHVVRVSDNLDMCQVQTLCSDPCNGQCTGMALEPSVEYALIVCKKSCNENYDCATCSSNCTANAQVVGG